MINNFPDSGEPEAHDREPVLLKSGNNSGKIWKRKPRIQARLPEGYHTTTLRKALGLALALSDKQKHLSVEDKADETMQHIIGRLSSENDKLREVISRIAFIPLKTSCTSSDEALYILGLPQFPTPTQEVIKKRYRELATIFHPDSICGDHERMSQLNAAFAYLKTVR